MSSECSITPLPLQVHGVFMTGIAIAWSFCGGSRNSFAKINLVQPYSSSLCDTLLVKTTDLILMIAALS